MLFLLFSSALPKAKVTDYNAYLNHCNIKVYKGPNTKSPLWKLTQRYYPLRVIGEFDNWCRVQEHDGSKGWIQKSNLSTRKIRGIITKDTTLKKKPNQEAIAIATLKRDVLVEIVKQEKDWVQITISLPAKKRLKKITGWIKSENMWF